MKRETTSQYETRTTQEKLQRKQLVIILGLILAGYAVAFYVAWLLTTGVIV